MKTSIYIIEPVIIRRVDNTLHLSPKDSRKADDHPGAQIAREMVREYPLSEEEVWWQATPTWLPVERIADIHVYTPTDLNTSLLQFLSQKGIPLHVYNYHGYYSGTWFSRDPMANGRIHAGQYRIYWNDEKRLELAREILAGAFHNMRSGIARAVRRKKTGIQYLTTWDRLRENLEDTPSIDSLMGLEGSLRKWYYLHMDEQLTGAFQIHERTYHPPLNPANAIISFLNSMLYTTILSECYRTQLTPEIGFIHEPGRHKYPLAYDLAEIFRPLLVEPLLLEMVSRSWIGEDSFDRNMNNCVLTPEGRIRVIRAFEHRLRRTIRHRSLNRSVSYRYLIRLECYKLIKHIINEQQYASFKIWW